MILPAIAGVLIGVSLKLRGVWPKSSGRQPGGLGRGGARFLGRLGGIRINPSLFKLFHADVWQNGRLLGRLQTS